MPRERGCNECPFFPWHWSAHAAEFVQPASAPPSSKLQRVAHVPRKISVPLPSDTSSPCATARYPGTRVNAATATRFPTMTADEHDPVQLPPEQEPRNARDGGADREPNQHLQPQGRRVVESHPSFPLILLLRHLHPAHAEHHQEPQPSTRAVQVRSSCAAAVTAARSLPQILSAARRRPPCQRSLGLRRTLVSRGRQPRATPTLRS